MVGVVDLGVDYLTDIEVIGQGGFAVVYSATDVRLDRRVAVKVLARAITGRDQDRFQRECRVMGRLSSHSNVVTLHDAGTSPSGHPFLIMELVADGTLADRLELHGPIPWSQAIRCILPICDALGHAHDAGILHRDVKPENILLAGDEPRLTDFGIAQLRDAAGGTSTGVSASWLHAAPETLDNARDARSDLYSLASSLFTLIAGRAPFWRDGEDSITPLMFRLVGEPPPDLPPGAGPEALNLFLRRALAKNPAERPQTAAEFADALTQLVVGNDDPRLAPAFGNLPATRRVMPPSETSELATSALVGLRSTGGRSKRKAARRLAAAGAFLTTAVLLVALARWATEPDVGIAGGTGTTNVDEVLPEPSELAQIDLSPTAATRHTGPINAIAVLPDGRIATGGGDGTVLVWGADYYRPPGSKAPMPTAGFAPYDRAVESLVALPDGRLVSTAADDNRVLIWDPDAADPRATVFARHDTPVQAIAALSNGLVASSGRAGVLVWDPDVLDAEPVEFLGHVGGALSLLGLADGRIASGGGLGDGRVLVWDPSQGSAPVVEFAGHTDPTLTRPAEATVTDLAQLRDGRIVSVSPGGLLVWEPGDTAAAVSGFSEPDSPFVEAVAVLPDGRLMVGSSPDYVEVVELDEFKPVVGFSTGEQGEAGPTTLAALPDFRVIIGRPDGSVLALDPYAD